MKNLYRNMLGLSFALALFLGLSATPAFSQTGAIEGTVRGVDGKPVGKDAALILIVPHGHQRQYKVKTSKKANSPRRSAPRHL